MADRSEREVLEEELQCAICVEILADPRILPCHHSFCHGCLVALRRSRGSLICPTCRHRALEDVDSLPSDFRANSRKERLEVLMARVTARGQRRAQETNYNRSSDPEPLNRSSMGVLILLALVFGLVLWIPKKEEQQTSSQNPGIQWALTTPVLLVYNGILFVIWGAFAIVKYSLLFFILGMYETLGSVVLNVKYSLLLFLWGMYEALRFAVINLPTHVFILGPIILPILAVNYNLIRTKKRRNQDYQPHYEAHGICAVLGGQLLSSYHNDSEVRMFDIVVATMVAMFLYLLLKGRITTPSERFKLGVLPLIIPFIMLAFMYKRAFGDFLLSILVTLYGCVLGFITFLLAIFLSEVSGNSRHCDFAFDSQVLLSSLTGCLFGDVIISVLSQILKPGIGQIYCMSTGSLIGLGLAKMFDEIYLPMVGKVVSGLTGETMISPKVYFAGTVLGSAVGFMVSLGFRHPVIGPILGISIFLLSPLTDECVAPLTKDLVFPIVDDIVLYLNNDFASTYIYNALANLKNRCLNFYGNLRSESS